MRYWLDFGDGTEGQSPTFLVWKNADTGADLVAPAISESGEGLYYFEWAWTAAASSISFKAVVLGIELSDVIGSTSVSTASGVASAGAAIPAWAPTAKDVINAVAIDCGLSEYADPYASTDANAIRLRTQLRKAGQALISAREWKHLVRELTITGDGTTTLFTPPADFLRMVDGSAFNRGTRWSLGLLTSQGWQALQATALTSSVRTLYRIVQGRIQFYTAPAAAAVVASDYVSRYWAATSGATSADLFYPTASTDRVLFDSPLAEAALKVRFLQSTGQDSSGALAEYQAAFEAMAGTEPAPVLSLSGGSGPIDRLVDGLNFPITGIGL
jgi:hypothetical protein